MARVAIATQRAVKAVAAAVAHEQARLAPGASVPAAKIYRGKNTPQGREARHGHGSVGVTFVGLTRCLAELAPRFVLIRRVTTVSTHCGQFERRFVLIRHINLLKVEALPLGATLRGPPRAWFFDDVAGGVVYRAL